MLLRKLRAFLESTGRDVHHYCLAVDVQGEVHYGLSCRVVDYEKIVEGYISSAREQGNKLHMIKSLRYD